MSERLWTVEAMAQAMGAERAGASAGCGYGTFDRQPQHLTKRSLFRDHGRQPATAMNSFRPH